MVPRVSVAAGRDEVEVAITEVQVLVGAMARVAVERAVAAWEARAGWVEMAEDVVEAAAVTVEGILEPWCSQHSHACCMRIASLAWPTRRKSAHMASARELAATPLPLYRRAVYLPL